MKTYHILNGDALLERFPEEITGDILVCRECLIDGPLTGKNLPKFFDNRMQFLADNYGEDEFELYLGAVLPEFEDMQNIEEGSSVYFWFEADLFCQFNFWFCASLMNTTAGTKYFLVMPEAPNQYGFSGLNNKELIHHQENAIPLPSMTMALLQELWKAVKKDDRKTALSLAGMLSLSVAGLNDLRTVLEDFYANSHLELLSKIVNSVDEVSFGRVFQEFSRQAPQYGFGDLQLKRFFDSIINS